jgi:2-phosphosulfolactate phosphatase
MHISHATNDTCAEATGLVVAIDVIRAFTTACYAFAAGAKEIVLVRGVEEALNLRDQTPGALVMGEVGGLPPEGFDYGNSPSALIGVDLCGRRIIQRTGAGTQGVVLSANAEVLLAASFANASATVKYIQACAPQSVTLLATGVRPPQYGSGYGDEDLALADYLEAALTGQQPNPQPYLDRVRHSRDADEDAKTFPGFEADMACCVGIDRVNFAMVVERRDGLCIMQPVAQ